MSKQFHYGHEEALFVPLWPVNHLAPRGKENSLRLEQVHKTYSVQSSFPSLEHLPFVSTSVAVIPAKGENWVSTS